MDDVWPDSVLSNKEENFSFGGRKDVLSRFLYIPCHKFLIFCYLKSFTFIGNNKREIYNMWASQKLRISLLNVIYNLIIFIKDILDRNFIFRQESNKNKRIFQRKTATLPLTVTTLSSLDLWSYHIPLENPRLPLFTIKSVGLDVQ